MWAPGAGAGPGTGPGWNEWSLNPSHYANLPHEQVDWAALAQQWIQMKTGNSESEPSQGPPPIPPHQFQPQHHQIQLHLHQPPPQLPPAHQQAQHSPQHQPHHHHHQLNSQPPPHHIHIPQLRQIHHPPPPPPQFQWQSDFQTERLLPPPQHLNSDVRQGLNSHAHNAFSASSNSHNTILPAPANNSHQPTGLRDGGSHWGGRAGAPVPLPPARDKFYASAHFNTESMDYNDDNVMSDQEAARRRSLPAWIREGLEKVEREKRKQEEKERLAMEKEATRQAEVVEAEENSGETNKWTNSQDDSEDENEHSSAPQDIAKLQMPKKPIKSEYDLCAVLGSMSEDERLEQTMLCVRRQLTKILLEVTTNEIEAVAQESMNRTKQKVISATQVRKTGALASLTTGPLGLTDYGSGSDSDSAASDKESNHSDSSDETSEAELLAEMEKKKRLFKLRELELGQSRQSTPKSRSASRSDSEGRVDDNTEHRADKVEKTILSNEISDKSANARGAVVSGISNSDSPSQPLAETGLIKSKSVERKDKSSKPSSNRSRSREKNPRKSRSHSKSRRRRNGSGRRHSKSRTPPRHRRSSRSQSTDREFRRRNSSSSRERSASNNRRRRSRSRSSRSSERKHQSSRRVKSRSRSISKKRRRRSRSRDRRRRRSYSSRSRGSSRDGSISNTKSRQKSRSRSRSKSTERKKKKKTSSRNKSRSPSVSRRKQKSRSKSKERRRRKSPRRRQSRSASAERSRKHSSGEVGRSDSRNRKKKK